MLVLQMPGASQIKVQRSLLLEDSLMGMKEIYPYNILTSMKCLKHHFNHLKIIL